MQKTLRIAVCEDGGMDAARLQNCIRQSGIPADCAVFSSGEAFLKADAFEAYLIQTAGGDGF